MILSQFEIKKSILLSSIFSIIFFLQVNAQNPGNKLEGSSTFINPMKVQFGDPFVLYTQGMYYMYGTGGEAKHGFAAYSSKDMVNWKQEGQVFFHNNVNGWGNAKAKWEGAYWAPEVYEVKGKFYLFYSAQWNMNPTNEEEKTAAAD